VNSNDKQLSELLTRWPDIHPRPAFAQDVLRRIRIEATNSRAPVQDWWVAWFESPRRLAWATGCACALTLATGVLTSLTPPTPTAPPSARPTQNFAFLDRGSLAGNYLALTGGQQP